MLSRVADSLFWMSRYIERAENNARIISTNLVSRLENVDPTGTNLYWQNMVDINTARGLFNRHYHERDARAAIEFTCFSALNPNAILQCVKLSRENARNIREMIPSELWENLNGFCWEAQDFPRRPWQVETVGPFLQFVKDKALTFQGIVDSVMSRGDAFLFISLGKFLERASMTTRILNVYFRAPQGAGFNHPIAVNHRWSSVLEAFSGYEAYVRHYHAQVDPTKVAEFLIFNETFPRSIRFCASQLMGTFETLEQGGINPYTRDLYISLGQLYADLNFTPVSDVLHDGALSGFFRTIDGRFQDIGRNINTTYYLGEI